MAHPTISKRHLQKDQIRILPENELERLPLRIINNLINRVIDRIEELNSQILSLEQDLDGINRFSNESSLGTISTVKLDKLHQRKTLTDEYDSLQMYGGRLQGWVRRKNNFKKIQKMAF